MLKHTHKDQCKYIITSVLTVLIAMMMSRSAYSEISFMTGQSQGQGRLSLSPIMIARHYGHLVNTDMNGIVDGGDNIQVFDRDGVGLKVIYGVTEKLDIFASYTGDMLPNERFLGEFTYGTTSDATSKQLSASTSSFGLKYQMIKWTEDWPFDVSLVLGYEWSDAVIKYNMTSPYSVNRAYGYSESIWSFGTIISGNLLDMVPYSGIYYRANSLHSNPVHKQVDGTSIAIDIGFMVKLSEASNLSLSYYREHQFLGDITFKAGGKNDSSARGYQGLSVGMIYKF